MKPDPKPTMSAEGILANISYYESRVKSAHYNWEQELQSLQHWMEQLDQFYNYQPTSDSVEL
jgi:hypothetical protein